MILSCLQLPELEPWSLQVDGSVKRLTTSLYDTLAVFVYTEIISLMALNLHQMN